VLTSVVLLLAAVGFAVVALVTGDVLLDGLDALAGRVSTAHRPATPPVPTLERFGAALLTGMGTNAVVGMVLGFAHAFYRGVLIGAGLVVVLVFRQRLARYARALRTSWRGALPYTDPVFGAVALAAIGLYAGMIVRALAPPTAYDELAYHLPEARVLADTHHLPLNLGGHFFYGNIPKLMEVLYAEGVSLGSPSLAHLLHTLVVTAFLIFAFAILRRMSSARLALVAVALVLTIPELTANGSSLYIDAGTVGFEAGALLSLAMFLEERKIVWIVRSAALLGFALSSKYTSLFTLLFAAAGLAIATIAGRVDRVQALRAVAVAVPIVFAISGYWYVKNLVRYGNPFYPLYLGHRGVSEEEYRSLLGAVQQFGPRTLSAFVRIPERFSTFVDLPTFVAFAVAPFAFFVSRARWFFGVLAVFFVAYLPYWFFVASQQTRFLLVALVVAMLIAPSALMQAPRGIAAIAAVAALALLVTEHPSWAITRQTLRPTVRVAFGVSDWRYAAGLQSKESFLHGYFGCQYSIVAWLNQRRLDGAVIDDWTRWHDPNVSVYSTRNEFAALALTRMSKAAVSDAVRRGGFRYLYVRASTRDRFADDTDPIIRRWRTVHLPGERLALEGAQVAFKRDDCTLYRLNAA
jgi:hypothetical protein